MSVTPPPTADERQVDQQTTTARQGRAKRQRRGKLFANLALLFLCLFWLLPTFGLLISSFREEDLVKTTGWWTVFTNIGDFSQWTLDNYSEVLQAGMGNAFINSIAVTVPAVVIPILAAAFAAYAFAWMRFPGRNILFIVVIGLLVVPLQVAFIPLLRFYSVLGLTGTFPAVWLAHTGFGMPLAVYLLRNYMGSLPGSIIESAKIDGADHFTIFTRLIVPLSVPVLASFAIFQFLWVWNDYLVALVFLGNQPSVAVLTVELATLAGRGEGALNLLPAAAFVTMILPMVVFFSLQRFFVRGLTAGSVKG